MDTKERLNIIETIAIGDKVHIDRNFVGTLTSIAGIADAFRYWASADEKAAIFYGALSLIIIKTMIIDAYLTGKEKIEGQRVNRQND